MSVRFRLGFMMFLQYAIWGTWSSVLSAYLKYTLGFTGTQFSLIYSLLPIATIIAPFDRRPAGRPLFPDARRSWP